MFLKFVTLLLACQLAGEAVTVSTGVPIPGPVIGMALLFGGLLLRGAATGKTEAPEGLQQTASTILGYLSLLFVPAGVGVMAHFSLLEAEWDAILVALIGSTVVTIAVTALIMKAFQRFGPTDSEGA